MAGVRFDHVTKRYGSDSTAVSDLNLEIADGEFLVLVGPSGCGKTTALRCVAGLETISEGHLYIGDRVVNEVAPKDRDIAMVFQSYALYPHMTVYDNLAFGLKLRKTPKADIDRRVKDAAQILGLEAYLDRKPRALSGGQRQRVALGRAIVREPQVFLMDEPLSNLDAKLRVQTRAEILRLQRQIGTTTLYVTHDQVEAMTMGDRIAVISAGVLQQAGTPRELYENPANMFVAGFIGSPAMNFARVETNGAGVKLGETTLSLGGAAGRIAANRPSGSTLVLGFRPEHLDIVDGGGDVFAVPAQVDVVEFMGSEELIHAKAEGVEVVAIIPSAREVRAGDRVNLGLALDKLHVFDPDTEQALVA
ncbi:MAG TPA: sn-glycerol-3-phosphate ABC transporter ATP-binding protein UgpC [Candidatus Limnocylindria bacterium]